MCGRAGNLSFLAIKMKSVINLKHHGEKSVSDLEHHRNLHTVCTVFLFGAVPTCAKKATRPGSVKEGSLLNPEEKPLFPPILAQSHDAGNGKHLARVLLLHIASKEKRREVSR